MASGDIKVMDDVAQEIAILHDGGRGTHVEREAEAALAFVAARLHANFHDALADGGFVAEFGDVADGIDQWVSSDVSASLNQDRRAACPTWSSLPTVPAPTPLDNQNKSDELRYALERTVAEHCSSTPAGRRP